MPEGIGTILYLGLFILVFYLLIIRPQSKRQKEHRALIESLKPADRVITGGGVYGLVRIVADDTVDIEISDGVIVTVAKAAVAQRADEE
jgi:preprotein translocase subunit YajC